MILCSNLFSIIWKNNIAIWGNFDFKHHCLQSCEQIIPTNKMDIKANTKQIIPITGKYGLNTLRHSTKTYCGGFLKWEVPSNHPGCIWKFSMK